MCMLVYCLTELVCSVSVVAILSSIIIIIMRKCVIHVVADCPFFSGFLKVSLEINLHFCLHPQVFITCKVCGISCTILYCSWYVMCVCMDV